MEPTILIHVLNECLVGVWKGLDAQIDVNRIGIGASTSLRRRIFFCAREEYEPSIGRLLDRHDAIFHQNARPSTISNICY
jgi:hypothetical protein